MIQMGTGGGIWAPAGNPDRFPLINHNSNNNIFLAFINIASIKSYITVAGIFRSQGLALPTQRERDPGYVYVGYQLKPLL